MNVFCSKSPFLSGLAVTALLLGFQVGSALAQEAPLQLTPPVEEAPQPVIPRPAVIEETPINAIDPDTIGTLTGEGGGFGVNMWRDTSRTLVADLMAQLPAGTSSRAMRTIMRRLLLSTAMPPVDPETALGGRPGEGTLLPLRTRQLVAMGETAAAVGLFKEVPSSALTESLRRTKIDALLVEGNLPQICGEAEAGIAAHEDVYFRKVNVYCKLAEGKQDLASLALDLVREMDKNTEDKVFYTIAETLLGLRKLSLSSLPDPEPLHVAMLLLTEKKLPADLLKNAKPPTLRALALNPKTDGVVRAAAAEQAASMGIFPAANLADLYATFTFTQKEFDTPLAQADEDKTIRSRALLYLAAVRDTRPEAKAEIISKGLELARGDNVYRAEADLYAPLIMEITPTPELAWFAGRAARALMSAGNPGTASTWEGLAETNAHGAAEAAHAAATLWPLSRISQGLFNQPMPVDGLAKWREVQTGVPSETASARQAVIMNLLSAFDDQVTLADWESLLGESPVRQADVPAAQVWHALQLAAVDGRVGETVLLSMLALGEAGTASSAATTLNHVVRALRTIGLGTEGRLLGLEAALDSGA